METANAGATTTESSNSILEWFESIDVSQRLTVIGGDISRVVGGWIEALKGIAGVHEKAQSTALATVESNQEVIIRFLACVEKLAEKAETPEDRATVLSSGFKALNIANDENRKARRESLLFSTLVTVFVVVLAGAGLALGAGPVLARIGSK